MTSLALASRLWILVNLNWMWSCVAQTAIPPWDEGNYGYNSQGLGDGGVGQVVITKLNSRGRKEREISRRPLTAPSIFWITAALGSPTCTQFERQKQVGPNPPEIQTDLLFHQARGLSFKVRSSGIISALRSSPVERPYMAASPTVALPQPQTRIASA